MEFQRELNCQVRGDAYADTAETFHLMHVQIRLVFSFSVKLVSVRPRHKFRRIALWILPKCSMHEHFVRLKVDREPI